ATVDHKKSRTSPTRFASQPVIGMEMAFATPNDVMTQVPWLSDALRLQAMVGIATFAMVESSTCMKVARDSAMVIMTSCAPSSGLRCCIALTSGLTRVGLNDVIDQGIHRLQADFPRITFIRWRTARLACQYLAVAVGGIHRHQRRKTNAQRVIGELFRIQL